MQAVGILGMWEKYELQFIKRDSTVCCISKPNCNNNHPKHQQYQHHDQQLHLQHQLPTKHEY